MAKFYVLLLRNADFEREFNEVFAGVEVQNDTFEKTYIDYEYLQRESYPETLLAVHLHHDDSQPLIIDPALSRYQKIVEKFHKGEIVVPSLNPDDIKATLREIKNKVEGNLKKR